MKQITSLFILIILATAPTFAQTSKVTSGVLDVGSQRYVEAISKLEKAIEDESLFPKKKAKHIPKANFALYQAYYAIGIEESGDMQKQLASQDLGHSTEHPLLLAGKHLKLALSHPMGKAQQTQATLTNANQNLWGALYNQAIVYFNEEGEESDKIAKEYFELADELNPDHMLTNRMLGAIQLITAPSGESPRQDSVTAVATLRKAIDLYKERYVTGDQVAVMKSNTEQFEQDSSQLSYLFQQTAVIYNAWGEPQKALTVLEEGLELSPGADDIKRQELNVYQQNPALFDQAKAKFTGAIEANPKDLQLKLAYASMLERNKEADVAFELYQSVYEEDPNEIGGIYGVGAYYINKAAAISEEKMKSSNDADIETMNEQILDLLEKGYPYMQKLHELQPTVREWLSQLINIAPILGKDEEMNAYYEKMKNL